MTQGEDNVSRMAGMDVYLPTGQKLGVVYDVVIDTDGIGVPIYSLEKPIMNWWKVA